MTRRTVVVGGGLAGATAATTLRELGFDGTVVLVGAEEHAPYERPALSKGYLAGTTDRADLLVHPASTYADLGIDLRLGAAAVALDPGARAVRLSDGTTVAYDDLVIATGSVNRRPSLPGTALPGVHQLRDLGEADRLREAAAGASSAVCVGTGFVGCEVAATLRASGLAVTLVGPEPGPLWGPLCAAVSRRVRRWHEEHGAHLLTGAGVAAIEGGVAVEQVRLDDGRTVPADLVVVGVGVRPATDWLSGSGLRRAHGAVLVDADGRSDVPGVLAVGDAAAPWDEEAGEHRHVEHYDAALAQGQRVAHAVLGRPAPRTGRSWFWSDQYDHTLQYSGRHDAGDELVWRGSSTGFFVRDGRVTAVVALDSGREFRRALPLVGETVDLAGLADPDVDLRRLRRPEPVS